MIFRGRTVASFVSVALLGSTAAVAQTATPASAPADSDTGEIVVTAQRRSEKLREVPLTVIAQSGASLAAAGVTSIREIGTVAPGVTFTAQGPFAQPNIRGVSTTLGIGSAESPIAMYVDGVYQPTQLGSMFDLPDVEQVEVLKGPQGTLYGRNATGGAIIINTRNPDFRTSGDLSVSNGVFTGSGVATSQHIITKGYLTAPIVSDVVAASIAGYYEHADGYLTNDVTGQSTGRISSYIVRGKLRIEPAPWAHLLLTGFISRRYDAAGASVAATTGVSVATQYPDAILPSRPWHVASEQAGGVSPNISKSRGVSLKASFDIANLGTLTSLSAYTYQNTIVYAEVDGAYAPSCVAVVACVTPYVVNGGPNKTFQQDIMFSSKDFGPVNFTLGALIYDDKESYFDGVNPPLVNGQPASSGYIFQTLATVKTTAYAGYIDGNWNITDRLHLTGGVRYSWEKRRAYGSIQNGPVFSFGLDPSWGAWTPRAALRFDVDNHTNIYAAYTKGFKSGVVNPASLDNVIANPETISSYEIGLKHSSHIGSLNLSAFYYDYKDIQVNFFRGIDILIGNAASAKIYGFDVDGTLHMGGGFDLRAAGSWVPHAKYESFANGVGFAFPMTAFGLQQVTVNASGDRMIRTPKFTGNLTLNYASDTSIGKIDASTTLYYSSQFFWDLLHRVKTDQYVTLSAQVGFTPADSRFRIGFYGKNLTNKAFVSGTTLSAEGDTYIYGAPREIGVNVGYKF